MGERNNGYASCDLRRNARNGMRGTGRYGRDTNTHRGTYNEASGCGLCQALRSGGNARAYANGRDGHNASCGCGCGYGSDRVAEGACANRECHALMRRLQQLDFSIQETVLYLDGYPDCAEALAYYHQLIKERCAVAEQYERACGPLTMKGNINTQAWNWVEAPWPWHPEFPGNKHQG